MARALSLVTSRQKLLADMCAAEGNVTALYLEAYTAQLRKMLPAKATGEELVAWMEESVKHPAPYKETVEHYKRLRNRSGGDSLKACVCGKASILLIYLCSLVATLWRRVMEKEPAAAVLEQSGEVGQGALFSAQQEQQLVELCAAEGANAAEYLEVYATELKKMLPVETTGEEITIFKEQAVKDKPAPQETVDHHEEPRVPVVEGQGDELTDKRDQPVHPTLPAWPVFTDEYQKFPKWKRDIVSYLKWFCSSLKEETKVLLLKKHCFSNRTVNLLESFETLDQIFVRLEQIYRKPACYTAEAMRPFRNQKLKLNDDYVGLKNTYQEIVMVLKEADMLRQMPSLSGPDIVWKMTHGLSMNEMGKWREFKSNKVTNYEFECECFLDFSISRLRYWSEIAEDMRSMTMESGSAPAAKPTGGQQDGHKKGGRGGRNDRRAWYIQSKINANPNSQVYSAVTQSQGGHCSQQPLAQGGPEAKVFRSWNCHGAWL
jgi:hypothetical protein